MSKSDLTVLMTVYNGMPYLAESVRSLLRQEDADFSVLILNNGSRDGTHDFLEKTLRERREAGPRGMPRIRVRHLPENIGRSRILGLGLEMVESGLTAILDADDVAEPGRIARQRAFFEAHPDIDLVGSDIIYIDGHGAETGFERFPPDHESLRDRLPLFNQFAHSACAFRTEAAREAGGYDESFPYAQDLALWIAMMRRGCRAASIPEPLARVRCHPGQSTRDLALLKVRALDNHRLAEAMLEIPGLAPASAQAALLRSGLALWRLHRRDEALKRFAGALRAGLFLLLGNKLVWRRLSREWRKRVGAK